MRMSNVSKEQSYTSASLISLYHITGIMYVCVRRPDGTQLDGAPCHPLPDSPQTKHPAVDEAYGGLEPEDDHTRNTLHLHTLQYRVSYLNLSELTKKIQ